MCGCVRGVGGGLVGACVLGWVGLGGGMLQYVCSMLESVFTFVSKSFGVYVSVCMCLVP